MYKKNLILSHAQICWGGDTYKILDTGVYNKDIYEADLVVVVDDYKNYKVLKDRFHDPSEPSNERHDIIMNLLTEEHLIEIL